MALVRHDTRELQFKIVYCGPPEGGKTTNLRYIHRRLDPSLRGDLVSLATDGDRTLYFDFLPVHATEIAGYRTRFQLYTVPGQEILADNRRAVLAGADGVVFVADSSPGRLEANLAAYADCRAALVANRIDPDRIPTAFQYNKRDAPCAILPDELDELLRVRVPSFLACAVSGYQVFATLDWLSGEVLKAFHASLEGPPRSKNSSTGAVPARTVQPVAAKP